MIPHARQRFNPRVYRAGTFERSVRSARTCDSRADQYRRATPVARLLNHAVRDEQGWNRGGRRERGREE